MALFKKTKQGGPEPDKTDASSRTGVEAGGAEPIQSESSRVKRSGNSGKTGWSSDGTRLSSGEKAVGSIGKSIVIKGELSGNEDVEIDGTVEGDIRLPEHVLTIGPNGQVSGTVHAKAVQVVGRVKGDVEANERIEIEASGVVEGDIRSPRLLVQEGAVINGTIEMTGGHSAKVTSARPTVSGEKSETEAKIQAV